MIPKSQTFKNSWARGDGLENSLDRGAGGPGGLAIAPKIAWKQETRPPKKNPKWGNKENGGRAAQRARVIHPICFL